MAGDSNGIQLRKIVGFNQKVKNGLAFFDPNTLFYLSGQQGVFHNLKTQKQKFKQIFDKDAVTAMNLNLDGFLVVASRGSDRKVTVYNLKNEEKRILPKAEKVGSDEYVAVCFSFDASRIGAQGGFPDWAFALWQWKTQQLERIFKPFRTEFEASIYNFSFCPSDSNRIVVFGHKFLRIYSYKDELKFQEMTFRDEERTDQSFHCNAWRNSARSILIGNSLGEILIIEGNDVVRRVSIVEDLRRISKENNKGFKPIRCLLASKNGLICSYGGQYVLFFDEDLEIRKVLNFPHTSRPSQAVQLILNACNGTLVAATEYGRILTYKMDNTHQEEHYEDDFTLLLDSQHIEQIVCSDTVLPISLQATCSSITIIIRDVFTGIVHHRTSLPANPKCVSLHPLGINVLIGFPDEWRIYNNLHDRLEEVVCCAESDLSQASFSPNGGLVVIVTKTIISFCDSICFNKLTTFEYLEPKIEKIIWRDNFHLLAADESGTLREWKVPKVERIWEQKPYKSQIVMALAVYSNSTFISTSNKKIIKFKHKNQFEKKVTVPTVITAMMVWKDMLLTGSDEGVVAGITLDLNKITFKKRCHSGNIVQISASEDTNVFIAVGADGAISYWSDSCININKSGEDKKILINTEEYQKMEKNLSDLEKKLNAQKEKTDKMKCELQNHHELSLKRIEEKNETIHESLRNTIKNLKEELTRIRSEQKLDLQTEISTVSKEMEDKDEHFVKRISEEKQRYQKVLSDQEKIENYYKNLILEKKLDIKTSAESFEERYQSHNKRLQELKEEINREHKLQKEISEAREQFLSDWTMKKWNIFVGSPSEKNLKLDLRNQQKQLELEMDDIRKQLTEEKNSSSKLKEEFMEKRINYEMLINKISDTKFLLKQTRQDISRMEGIIKEKIGHNENLEQDLKELEAAGDMNLKELESKLEAKNAELEGVKNELLINEEKFDNLTKRLKKVKIEESQLVEKLKSTEKSVHDSTQELLRSELMLEQYRKEFIACTSNVPSAYALRWAILRLYDKRVVKKQIREEDVQASDTDPFNRFCKQRDHYESLINQVHSRKDQVKETYRQSFVKLAQENSDWTAFSESLQSDIKNKKERIKCLEDALELRACEFSSDPAETQKRFKVAAERCKQLEDDESNEIQKRLDLIHEQASEILRLHALINVDERHKIVRKDVF